MSIEMKVMCEKVRPQPGSKKRRFASEPFENIHSSNFAAAQRYICSKQTPVNHPAPEERYIGSKQTQTKPSRSGGALYW